MESFAPSDRFVAVTPSDAELVTYEDSGATLKKFRGLYVGTAGDVAVKNVGGEAVVFAELAAGVVHPISGSYVMETGTDADGIVALF